MLTAENITINTPIHRRVDALTAQVDGETVMIDAERGAYYGLDVIGSDVWRRLAEPTSPARLIADLIASYDGDPDDIERDTMALLRQLIKYDLIVVEAAPATS